jgi:TonB-dependent receptor
MKLPIAFATLAAGCSLSSIATAQTATAVTPQARSANPQGSENDSASTDPAAQVDGAQTAGSQIDKGAAPADIIVTGVRASLQRAADIKRRSDVISDTISAEDIGKFPDANVADALQRVTGVQISRTSGGEGRFVSIRGLGSQFNITTFNGRVLATDNAGRDFSFDVLPAEVLGSATVYKSPSASLVDGSIGGLVELTTIDPLARPGLHFSGSLGGLYDESTKRVTPRFGGAISNTFADNTLGVFFGGYYYKRQWRSDTFESFARSTETIAANGDGCYSCTGIGRAAFPGIVSYQVKNGPRERISLVGGIQWQPNDRIKTKIDAFYSHYDTPENNVSYNINFYSNDGWARFRNATFVDWPGPGSNRYLLTQFNVDNIPVELGTDTHVRKVSTWQVGWNTVYDVMDNFTAKLDVAYSKATRPNRGEDYYTVAGVTGATYEYALTNQAPNVSCTLAGGGSCYDITNNDINLHFLQQSGESTKDTALSSRLDFEFKAGQVGSFDALVKFGGFYSNRKKTRDQYQSPNACGYCGFEENLGALGVNAVVPFPYGSGYRSGTIGTNNRWPTLSAERLFEAAILARGQAFFDQNIAAAYLPRGSSFVDEDQYGGYVQVGFKNDALDLNAGVRYVETRDAVRGSSQQLLTLTPIPNSTNYTATYSDVVPVTDSNKYGNWLPSVNATWHITPNLQLRAAASKAVTRPTFSQLGLDVNYEVNSPPPRVSQNGNPQLRAIKADSADLSLEWYGRQGSSASIAGFYKDIDGFITTGTFETTLAGLPGQITLPINGDTAKLRGIEAAFQHVFPFGLGGQVNYTYVSNSARITVPGGETVSRGLDGVSKHTVNVSGFYEKGPISARLSYTYRSSFVDAALGGPVSTPSTTAASGFMDFSGSYKVTPQFSVYLDIYNLTKEDSHRFALDKRETLFYEQYSRRLEFGVRASF